MCVTAVLGPARGLCDPRDIPKYGWSGTSKTVDRIVERTKKRITSVVDSANFGYLEKQKWRKYNERTSTVKCTKTSP